MRGDACGRHSFTQLTKESAEKTYGLDAKIQTEIAENEEGAVWSDRKARLLDCIAQKKGR